MCFNNIIKFTENIIFKQALNAIHLLPKSIYCYSQWTYKLYKLFVSYDNFVALQRFNKI